MNDEFYSKFPSYNENSKENRRHRKLTLDYNNAFLETKPNVVSKNQQRSKIPVSKQQNQQIDVFSVEERNERDASETKEKKANYQKSLLEQIEQVKIEKQAQKDKEIENERKLEEKIQKQIASMSIQPIDQWQNRPVERISFSENDKHPPRRLNDVYRYFSKSSNSLFSYNNNYASDIDSMQSEPEKKFIALCDRCQRTIENTQYKKRTDLVESPLPSRKVLRTKKVEKIGKFRENHPPYTFNNANRYHKSSNDLNYLELFNEFKKRKIVAKKDQREVKSQKKNDDDLEDLLGSNHRQYTVITGYAKSLLAKET